MDAGDFVADSDDDEESKGLNSDHTNGTEHTAAVEAPGFSQERLSNGAQATSSLLAPNDHANVATTAHIQQSRSNDPALIDVFVPAGAKHAKSKTNPAEARALVSYLRARLAPTSSELAARGATLFAKNSDRERNEAQGLELHPPQSHPTTGTAALKSPLWTAVSFQRQSYRMLLLRTRRMR